MNEIIKGEEIGSRVLNSSGGAYVRDRFKIDCIKFSWVDFYLRDEILRKKIQTLNDNIQKIKNSPIHKDELKAMFQCAISNINSARLSWFVEKLKAVQARQGEMINSYTVQGNRYIPTIDLSKSDVDAIFSQLPEEGVSQADIDAGIQQMRKEIARAEEIINRELSPPERWIYKDDGKPIPYPQGCRWTQ